MRKIVLLTALFLSVFDFYSQNETIDSLRLVLSSEVEGLEKLSLVLELHKEFAKQTNYDSMNYYHDIGFEVANQLNDSNALVYTKVMEGIFFYKKGKYKESLFSFKDAESLLSSNDNVLREYIYSYIGVNYFVIGASKKSLDSCLIYYKKAKWVKNTPILKKSKIYQRLSQAYSLLGIKDSVIVYNQELLKLYTETKNNQVLRSYYSSKVQYFNQDKNQDSILKYRRLIYKNVLDSKDSTFESKKLLNVEYYKMGISFYKFNNLDSAIFYLKKCIELSYEIKDVEYFRHAMPQLTFSLGVNENIEELLDVNNKSIDFALLIGDTVLLAKSKIGLSYVYDHTKEYSKSINLINEVLTDYSDFLTEAQVCAYYANLIYFYCEDKRYKESIENGLLALECNPENSLTLFNLADAYLAAYKDSLIPKKEILPREMHNEYLGDILSEKEAKQKVLILIRDYYEKSEKILLEAGNEKNLLHPYLGLGDYYDLIGEEKKVIYYYELAWKYSKGNNVPYKDEMKVSNRLYNLYKKRNDSERSLFWLEISDSLEKKQAKLNDLQELGKKQAEFEYSQKLYADSLQQKEKDLKIKYEQEQQELQLKSEEGKKYYLYGGLLLLAIFLLVLYRRFKIAMKQKDLIELQKESIEEKRIALRKTHEGIQDSINYSKKIQKAVFPSLAQVKSLFPNSFVFFKPKDVVSGDFYWVYEIENKKIIVTADCTGHGVPGAFMTIIGINILKEIVQEGIVDSKIILKEINKRLIKRLSEDGKESVKDGMDLALCVIDSNTIEFVGAHLPLYHVRNGELNEYKGNNVFLGSKLEFSEPKVYYIPYQKGDYIFMSTDGLPDQKGGDKGKKFYVKRMREFLLKNSSLTMFEQEQELQNLRKEWIGDQFEQLDDMTVVGIKL